MHYWTRSDGRYYVAFITKDLFGFWSVVKCWGGKGRSHSSMEAIACEDIDSAMQLIAAIARVRKYHGYEKRDVLFKQQLETLLAANDKCKSLSC